MWPFQNVRGIISLLCSNLTYHGPSTGYKVLCDLEISLPSCPSPLACSLGTPAAWLFLEHASDALTSSLCPGCFICSKYSDGYQQSTFPHFLNSNEMSSSQWEGSSLFKLWSVTSPAFVSSYTNLLFLHFTVLSPSNKLCSWLICSIFYCLLSASPHCNVNFMKRVIFFTHLIHWCILST